MKNYCEQAYPVISEQIEDAQAETNPLLRQDLQNGLYVLYVVEQDGHQEFLRQQHLLAGGMKFADLQALSLANLKKKLVANFKLMQQGSHYFLRVEHDFVASILLVTELWEREFLRHVQNGFMIALPHNRLLAFCDSKSEAGIAELKKIIANQAQQNGHSSLLSSTLFRRQLGQWRRIEDVQTVAEKKVAELKENLLASAEVARGIARKAFQQEVDYDIEGVRWADRWLDLLHESSDPSKRNTTVQALAAFIGECIIRNIGGAWGLYEGEPWVRFDDNNGCFPFNWVTKHLDNGKEAGDCVSGKYESLLAMRPKGLSTEQQRLKDLYEAGGGLHIFIPNIGGSETKWQRLSKLEGGWLRGDDPRIGTALHTLKQYYVLKANGELLCFAGPKEDLPAGLQTVRPHAQTSPAASSPTTPKPAAQANAANEQPTNATALTLAQLEAGKRYLEIRFARSLAEPNNPAYFATTLRNTSLQRIRVLKFGGFQAVEQQWVLNNASGDFYSAQKFREWYGQKNVWLQPGESVCDDSNWGGLPCLWAYYCETEMGEAILAGAVLEKPLSGQENETTPSKPQTNWRGSADPIAQVSPSPAPAKPVSSKHRIPSLPENPQLGQALAELRSNFMSQQKSLHENRFNSIRAALPHWLEEHQRLAEVVKQQWRLHTEGRIVWAALVQENNLLSSANSSDCAGLLVYGTEPYFDTRPHELKSIAEKILQLNSQLPSDQIEREMVAEMRAVMRSELNWSVPTGLTEREVWAASFIRFGKHVPNGVLAAKFFPILIHAELPTVMILPFEFWPLDFLMMWKQGKLA